MSELRTYADGTAGLPQRFYSSPEYEELHDCYFAVGTVRLPVHYQVLALSSKFFLGMSEVSGKREYVETDFSLPAVLLFLRALYSTILTGCITASEFAEVIGLADKLDCPSLLESLRDATDLPDDDDLTLLAAARKYHLGTLAIRCHREILRHHKEPQEGFFSFADAKQFVLDLPDDSRIVKAAFLRHMGREYNDESLVKSTVGAVPTVEGLLPVYPDPVTKFAREKPSTRAFAAVPKGPGCAIVDFPNCPRIETFWIDNFVRIQCHGEMRPYRFGVHSWVTGEVEYHGANHSALCSLTMISNACLECLSDEAGALLMTFEFL